MSQPDVAQNLHNHSSGQVCDSACNQQASKSSNKDLIRKYSRKIKLKRFPLTQPLFHETYLQACRRQLHLVELYKRVENAHSMIDTGPPRTHINSRVKLKKLMLEGERLARQEMDNKHMMKEILRVMKGPGMVEHYHTRDLTAYMDTLNYDARRRWVNKINRENKNMLKRILETGTCYDHIQMEIEYQKKLKATRPRSFVFQQWNQQKKKRQHQMLYGTLLEERDYQYPEVIRQRLLDAHKNCFPIWPEPYVKPAPLPVSSSPPPGHKPTDHSRCFAIPPMLPPMPHCLGMMPRLCPADRAVPETKAQMLRTQANMEKIEALKPKPFCASSRAMRQARQDDNQSASPLHHSASTTVTTTNPSPPPPKADSSPPKAESARKSSPVKSASKSPRRTEKLVPIQLSSTSAADTSVSEGIAEVPSTQTGQMESIEYVQHEPLNSNRSAKSMDSNNSKESHLQSTGGKEIPRVSPLKLPAVVAKGDQQKTSPKAEKDPTPPPVPLRLPPVMIPIADYVQTSSEVGMTSPTSSNGSVMDMSGADRMSPSSRLKAIIGRKSVEGERRADGLDLSSGDEAALPPPKPRKTKGKKKRLVKKKKSTVDMNASAVECAVSSFGKEKKRRKSKKRRPPVAGSLVSKSSTPLKEPSLSAPALLRCHNLEAEVERTIIRNRPKHDPTQRSPLRQSSKGGSEDSPPKLPTRHSTQAIPQTSTLMKLSKQRATDSSPKPRSRPAQEFPKHESTESFPIRKSSKKRATDSSAKVRSRPPLELPKHESTEGLVPIRHSRKQRGADSKPLGTSSTSSSGQISAKPEWIKAQSLPLARQQSLPLARQQSKPRDTQLSSLESKTSMEIEKKFPSTKRKSKIDTVKSFATSKLEALKPSPVKTQSESGELKPFPLRKPRRPLEVKSFGSASQSKMEAAEVSKISKHMGVMSSPPQISRAAKMKKRSTSQRQVTGDTESDPVSTSGSSPAKYNANNNTNLGASPSKYNSNNNTSSGAAPSAHRSSSPSSEASYSPDREERGVAESPPFSPECGTSVDQVLDVAKAVVTDCGTTVDADPNQNDVKQTVADVPSLTEKVCERCAEAENDDSLADIDVLSLGDFSQEIAGKLEREKAADDEETEPVLSTDEGGKGRINGEGDFAKAGNCDVGTAELEPQPPTPRRKHGLVRFSPLRAQVMREFTEIVDDGDTAVRQESFHNQERREQVHQKAPDEEVEEEVGLKQGDDDDDNDGKEEIEEDIKCELDRDDTEAEYEERPISQGCGKIGGLNIFTNNSKDRTAHPKLAPEDRDTTVDDTEDLPCSSSSSLTDVPSSTDNVERSPSATSLAGSRATSDESDREATTLAAANSDDDDVASKASATATSLSEGGAHDEELSRAGDCSNSVSNTSIDGSNEQIEVLARISPEAREPEKDDRHEKEEGGISASKTNKDDVVSNGSDVVSDGNHHGGFVSEDTQSIEVHKDHTEPPISEPGKTQLENNVENSTEKPQRSSLANTSFTVNTKEEDDLGSSEMSETGGPPPNSMATAISEHPAQSDTVNQAQPHTVNQAQHQTEDQETSHKSESPSVEKAPKSHLKRSPLKRPRKASAMFEGDLEVTPGQELDVLYQSDEEQPLCKDYEQAKDRPYVEDFYS